VYFNPTIKVIQRMSSVWPYRLTSSLWASQGNYTFQDQLCDHTHTHTHTPPDPKLKACTVLVCWHTALSHACCS